MTDALLELSPYPHASGYLDIDADCTNGRRRLQQSQHEITRLRFKQLTATRYHESVSLVEVCQEVFPDGFVIYHIAVKYVFWKIRHRTERM